jgi:hypothetical protein
MKRKFIYVPAGISMSIGYPVPLIPQTTSMSCWAAGIAMILAWKDNVSINPRTIAENPGGVSYLAQFAAGLNPNDTTILTRWGFVTEPPRSYTPEDFSSLLQRFGPLWVAARVPGPHIRVVTGFQPAFPSQKSIVAINDPWAVGMNAFHWPNQGSQYTRTYLKFMREVEGLARQEMAEPSPVYIAHLP